MVSPSTARWPASLCNLSHQHGEAMVSAVLIKQASYTAISESNSSIAIQPFTQAISSTASTVLVDTRVVGLTFSLFGYAACNDVVHLHITSCRIIDEFHQDVASGRAVGGVVLIAVS